MPIPVYIICCESGTEDKYTGMASLFNIIDRISLKTTDAQKSEIGLIGRTSPPIRIVAVWSASHADDFEGEFISEVRMSLLPKNQEATLLSDSVRFTSAMPRHRSTVIVSGFQSDEKTGNFVSKAGSNEGCDGVADTKVTLSML